MSKRDLPLFRKTTDTTDVEPITMEHLANGELLDDLPPGYSLVPPLTKKERRRLEELESIVTRNFRAFYEVGCALREIRQRRLYRETHQTFADYCKDLWDIARQTAYQYIDAAEVVDNVRQIGWENVRNCGQNESDSPPDENVRHGRQNESDSAIPLPMNECQARALAKYDPEKQREIWIEAVKSAPRGKITASHIRKTARRLHHEKVGRAISKASRGINHLPKVSEDFRRAYLALIDQINAERAEDYRYTDPQEIAKLLRAIIDALEAEL